MVAAMSSAMSSTNCRSLGLRILSEAS